MSRLRDGGRVFPAWSLLHHVPKVSVVGVAKVCGMGKVLRRLWRDFWAAFWRAYKEASGRDSHVGPVPRMLTPEELELPPEQRRYIARLKAQEAQACHEHFWMELTHQNDQVRRFRCTACGMQRVEPMSVTPPVYAVSESRQVH